jgi:hypothetical protein
MIEMELLEGGSLKNLISERLKHGYSKFSEEEAS